MLNKPIEEIVVENGKVVGVKSEGEVSAHIHTHTHTHTHTDTDTDRHPSSEASVYKSM